MFTSLSCSQAFAADKLITLQEVQEHSKPDDCWIVVNDSVYNISPYIKKHEDLCKEMKLTDSCGSDASSIWNTKEKGEKSHKRKAVMAFERSKVGILTKK